MNRAFLRSTSIGCTLQILLLVFSVRLFAEEQYAGRFYLQAGDRVVFFGDSITEQAYYTLPIEKYVALRYPELGVSFVNSGWGGDRAWGGDGGMLDERLKRDVLAHKPTVVTVMLGMNDGYYTNFDQKAVDAFRVSLETLIETLQAELPEVRITLIGTSPYDNITPGEQPDWEKNIEGGYDSVIARYSQAMRDVAEKHQLQFVDMHEPLVGLLEKLQAENPKLARELIPDRIHPGKAGGLIMAAELLKVWQAPEEVPAVEIEADQFKEGRTSANQQLPNVFPLDMGDPLTRYLMENSDLLKNVEGFTVFAPPVLRFNGLPANQVSLRIDGQDCGSFTAKQLSDGIPCTNIPELESHAEQAGKLIDSRNRLAFIKWRYLEVPTKEESEPIKQAVAGLADVEKELQKLQQGMAKPSPRFIELIESRN